jgi:hypothetical protein
VFVGTRKPRGSVAVRHGVLTIRLTRGARRIVVRIDAPAVSTSAALARAARRRRARRRTVTLTIRDGAHNVSSVKLRLRPS